MTTQFADTRPTGTLADAAARQVLAQPTHGPDHTIEALLAARDSVEAAVRGQIDDALRDRLVTAAAGLGFELSSEETAAFINVLTAVRRRYGGPAVESLVRGASND
jgi:hypothetical protein